MTWTYSGSPASSDLDAVRFAIGDTVETDPLLTDEEITYALVSSTVSSASVSLVRGLIARFSRGASDRQVGNLRIKGPDRAAGFRLLLADLLRNSSVPTPYAGGISRSDKYDRELDTDRVRPSFVRYPGHSYDYDRYERFG